MISSIDTYLGTRLSKILFGSGEDAAPVTVYGYLPERDHKHTVYPCIGFTRHTYTIQTDMARPNCECFTASGSQVIDVQENMGDGQLSGPTGYAWKPYPTPVTVLYEIHVASATESHTLNLAQAVISLFPPGHMTTLSGFDVLFALHECVDIDERELPLFKKSFLLSVHDVMLTRPESAAYKPIVYVQFEDDTTTTE